MKKFDINLESLINSSPVVIFLCKSTGKWLSNSSLKILGILDMELKTLYPEASSTLTLSTRKTVKESAPKWRNFPEKDIRTAPRNTGF